MRVLHVVGSMNPQLGGVSQAVRTIVLCLNNAGFYNEVVSLDSADASFLSNEAITIHPLGTGKGSWGYSAKLLPWLKNNLGQFDSVIIHGLWQYHSFSVRKAVKLFQKGQHVKNEQKLKVPKIFVMPHGMLDPYFQKAKGRRLKAIRNWFYWKVIEGFVINNADGILFTCEEEKTLAKDTFRPYHPKAQKVVGLGVIRPPSYTATCKNSFLRNLVELANNRYLLFLSRIHEKKGVDLLVESYKQLYNSIKEKDELPKLVIAGPGINTPYGIKIKQLVDETEGLASHIYFAGMLQGDAKWGAFYGCDAFILSSHQENFGIAVVEALACEKPVLISNQVNIFKEIEENCAGIVKDDTMEGTLELLNCWNKLSAEKKLYMGKQAKLTYEKKFSIETVSKNLIKVLEER